MRGLCARNDSAKQNHTRQPHLAASVLSPWSGMQASSDGRHAASYAVQRAWFSRRLQPWFNEVDRTAHGSNLRSCKRSLHFSTKPRKKPRFSDDRFSGCVWAPVLVLSCCFGLRQSLKHHLAPSTLNHEHHRLGQCGWGCILRLATKHRAELLDRRGDRRARSSCHHAGRQRRRAFTVCWLMCWASRSRGAIATTSGAASANPSTGTSPSPGARCCTCAASPSH